MMEFRGNSSVVFPFFFVTAQVSEKMMELHYVLDNLVVKQIQSLQEGKSIPVHYANDFIQGFTEKEDTGRVLKVLLKRPGKYALTLYPEKTRLTELLQKGQGGERQG
jgi:hypothetical protein